MQHIQHWNFQDATTYCGSTTSNPGEHLVRFPNPSQLENLTSEQYFFENLQNKSLNGVKCVIQKPIPTCLGTFGSIKAVSVNCSQ